MEKIKINLGCGTDIRKGWINVDRKDFGQEIKHDLNAFPYPFKDNSADIILMKDILEHLLYPVKVMKEVYRIASDGCTLIIRTPHPKSPLMYKDETHLSYISKEFLKVYMPEIIDAELIYYHCQKGLLHYWNQLAVYKIKKER